MVVCRYCRMSLILRAANLRDQWVGDCPYDLAEQEVARVRSKGAWIRGEAFADGRRTASG